MMEKFVLPLTIRYKGQGSKEGWRKVLYTHFKNTGDTYFEYKCKATKSQTEFIVKRREERIKLQEKHFDEDIEGRELKIPSVEEETKNYARHSEFYDDPDEMAEKSKSQKNRGPPEEEDTNKPKPTPPPPLPSLEVLHQLSTRLRKAAEASVLAREKGKRKIAVEQLTQGVDAEDSSEDEAPPPKKVMRVDSDRARKAKKSKSKESSSSASSSSSSSSSDSESSDDRANFRSKASEFNFDSTLDRTPVKASAPTSRLPPPGGKPKAFATFMSHPPRKNKHSQKSKKSTK